ncbi:MAG: hypothetical protein JO295_06545 [Verrucomicrobia bacterium]|nr:hypothetical protein [Verrucomicrobiota bacterium]
MTKPIFPLFRFGNSRRFQSAALTLLLAAAWTAAPGRAQIPAAPPPTAVVLRAHGATDQPFNVQVIDARRAVGQTLILRLTLTNEGRAPLAPRFDFAGSTLNAADQNRIAGLYFIDPNGQQKYAVLRDAAGVAQCSLIDPPLVPGEHREVRATFPAPPATSNTISVFFPKTTEPIAGVPIGLSAGGEPVPANAPLPGQPSPPPTVSASTPPPANNPESNFKPNVYTNELPGSAPAPTGTTKKTVGHIQAANSDAPFTVEVISLHRISDHQLDLKLALTNNSSGPLDVGEYFTGGLADTGNARRISGVYLVDPLSQSRYNVSRDPQNHAACSEVDPPLAPGERRELTARLVGPQATARNRNAQPPANFYLYFPQASPIAEVPVNP